MPEVSLRQATSEDVPALHRLVESAYRGESAKAGWTHEADLLSDARTDADELQAILADPDSRIIVAERDGVLCGCVHIHKKSVDLAYLGLLTVDPVLQAAGLGRSLLNAAEAAAVSVFAVRAIEMTVIAQRSELIAWYQRRGYALTGEQRPFPYDPDEAGHRIRRDLYFVVLQKALSSESPVESEAA